MSTGLGSLSVCLYCTRSILFYLLITNNSVNFRANYGIHAQFHSLAYLIYQQASKPYNCSQLMYQATKS